MGTDGDFAVVVFYFLKDKVIISFWIATGHKDPSQLMTTTTTTTTKWKRHINTPKLAKQVPPFQPKGELTTTTKWKTAFKYPKTCEASSPFSTKRFPIGGLRVGARNDAR
jgi:hypothetical protein